MFAHFEALLVMVTHLKISRLVGRLPISDILRAGHSTVLRLAASGLTLVFGIVATRLLTAEVFGAYVSILALAGVLTIATSIGLPALLMREISASRGSGDRRALRPIVQGLIFINGALVLALSSALIGGAATISAILVFCLFSSAAGLLGAVFISYERVLLASWIGNVLAPTVSILALTALTLLSTPSEILPLIAQTIGAAAAIGAFLVLWNAEPLGFARRAFDVPWWSDQHARVVRAGLTFAATQVLINLTTQIDILILTAMATPEEVAHYYAAVRAAIVISFFSGASGLLAEPILTRLRAAGQTEEAQTLATRTALTGAIVTVCAAAAAVAVAPSYLRLYGPDFEVAFPSFCIVTAGLVARSLCGPAEPLMRATRLDSALLRMTAGVLALNAVVTILLVPLMSIQGAAVGSGLQFAAYGVLLARTLWRHKAIRADVFLLAASRSRAVRPRATIESSEAPW